MLVVDFNVIFSSALGIGHSYMIFYLNNKERKFRFITPEYMYVEIGMHTEEIAKRSNFSLEKAQEVLKFIIKQITFIQDQEFNYKIEEAKQILKGHEKDVPYLALALARDCDILSGDKIFKQLSDKVKSPREILEMFNRDSKSNY